SADGDERDLISDARAEPTEDVERALAKGGAAKSSASDGLDLALRERESIPPDGRVGGDDPIDAEVHGEIGDLVDVFIGKVGSDLHEQRDVPSRMRVEALPHGS